MQGNYLTTTESGRLQECEATIEAGMRTFVEVGTALLEIRDSRLYRTSFGTFEEYCRDRWGFNRTYAFYLIGSAEVVNNLNVHNCEHLPATESQARPLSRLEPQAQAEVWAQVVQEHGDKVTAAKVETAVFEHLARQEPEVLDFAPRPHVSNNSGDNEWYTPAEYMEAAREVLGEIDLDPASSAAANEVVMAAEYFDERVNGLDQEWSGRVWMNPPYSQPLVRLFCEKLAAHYSGGDVQEAVVLVNNATETGWFQDLAAHASAICFPRGRVKFWAPGKESAVPLQGQAIIYLGIAPVDFAKAFSKFGTMAQISHE